MNSQRKEEIQGIGRRKTSIATLFLIPHISDNLKVAFEVNRRSGEEYFQYNFNSLHQIYGPLRNLDLMYQYKLIVRVKGGGLTGQADAIKLALARALCSINPTSFRSSLKKEGYLKRDSRIKERRKYGLKKARKASQSSKR